MTALVDGQIVHVCARPGCGVRTHPNRAFCGQDYRSVPHDIRQAIYRSWDRRSIEDHLGFLRRVGERINAGEGEWPEW